MMDLVTAVTCLMVGVAIILLIIWAAFPNPHTSIMFARASILALASLGLFLIAEGIDILNRLALKIIRLVS